MQPSTDHIRAAIFFNTQINPVYAVGCGATPKGGFPCAVPAIEIAAVPPPARSDVPIYLFVVRKPILGNGADTIAEVFLK